jgi:hypothetical protein
MEVQYAGIVMEAKAYMSFTVFDIAILQCCVVKLCSLSKSVKGQFNFRKKINRTGISICI